MKRYRWSSYVWYLNRAGRGPKWLRRDRVMASVGLSPGESRGYEAYIEGRVLELGIEAGRKELEEEWKKLRRGWLVGGRDFLEKLQGCLGSAVRGRRRESHSGGAKRGHDEAAAERKLALGLKAMGLREKDLEWMPKGAGEKVVLASWLRERTVMPLRWVSQRLRMGHYTRVTQAVGRMKGRPGGKLEKLKRKLARLEADESATN